MQKYRAESFLVLSESIDLHQMDATQVHTPATLIAVREDQLVPFNDMQALSARLNGPRQLIEINSIFGHDAFLKEGAALTPIIKQPSRSRGHEQQSATQEKHRHALGSRRARVGCTARLRGAADLSVDEFCLREIRQAAQVRLHPVRQSDPRSIGRRLGGSRRRRRRGGDLHGLVGHHFDSGDAAERRPRHRALRLLRRHVSIAGGAARAREISWSISSIRATPAALQAALAPGAKLVWIETPSNPLLRVVDIRAIADAAHAAGALAVVDNTFLSPIWQQPLKLGADMVMHSTTKYLNGHSDVVGGAVIAATAELHDNLAWWANAIGVTGAPFDSFMTLRGVRSLHARMRVHAENTAAVVDFLTQHSAVERVHYPGLPDHPGHEIARRQQSGFGAMLSFELARRRTRGRGVPLGPRVLHPRRVAGRGGEPDLASCEHDSRRHGGIGAAARRNRRGVAARFRRHRRCRGSGRRSCRPGSSAPLRAQPAPHLRRHAS